MLAIDLNADVAEGSSEDGKLLSVITSANLACGVHAGGPDLIERTVRQALRRRVALGAHPGLADRGGVFGTLRGFGRRKRKVSPREAEALITYQVGAFAAFARRFDARFQHVKLHGWLYHLANRDGKIARAVACAVSRLEPRAILVGAAGGTLARAARSYGLRFAREAFADRAYRADGTLVPRSEPHALVNRPEQAARQALEIVFRCRVPTVDGSHVQAEADTLCVHSDTPGAARIARAVARALREAGVRLVRMEKILS